MKQKDEKIELILDEIATTEEMHKNNFSIQLEMMDYLKGWCSVLYLLEFNWFLLIHNFFLRCFKIISRQLPPSV